MRDFNYTLIKEKKWDSELLSLIGAIYKEAGKQELYLKQKPEELKKLVEIAKVQSTEASNAIEGIVTTNTRIRQLVEELVCYCYNLRRIISVHLLTLGKAVNHIFN